MRRLALAFAFLTRLPVRPRQHDDAALGRSVAFFPLVGLVLGLLLALGAATLGGQLPPGVLAVLIAALLALLTGALHLDGVADAFDALGAQTADRARRLEILRDSRIGAHGACALIFVVAAKVLALQALLAAGQLAPLVVFPVVARWTACLAIVLLPYARERGLGTSFRAHARRGDVLAATVLTALVLWAADVGWAAAAGAATIALGFAALAARRFGGATGDVYGAVIEIAEVAFLILFLMRALPAA